MMEPRPDPITPKVTWLVGILTMVGSIITLALDALNAWSPPTENTIVAISTAVLPVILAVLGGIRASTWAKRETTPLVDPRTDDGLRLVPEAGAPRPEPRG